MAYVKTTWQNSPSTNTPINATNLNHIEQGIYDAAATADQAEAGVESLDPRMDLVEQRLDNLIPEGTPTQGNAELIDIRVGADGVTYPDAGSAVRGQVTAINSALSQIIIDFDWIASNKVYSLTTGEIESQSQFTISAKMIGDDFTKQFNYEEYSPSYPKQNIVSFWLNGSYVGYYYRGTYKDPSGTTITKPSYDSWALSCATSEISNFHSYTVAYKEDLVSIESDITTLENAVSDIDDRTEELVTDFTYTNGYYLKFADGTPKANASYNYSNRQKGSQFAFANPSAWDLNPNYNYVSFWYQGTYVGYYLNGKYYDPTQTEVESLTYDEWAVNAYSTSIALKPVSVDSRLDALESIVSSRYEHLRGKKIGFLGDSITNGVGATDYAHSYVGLMENEFGSGNVGEYGINATLIAVVEGQKPTEAMCVRYTDMPNDLDIVVVYGGTNDWYYGGAWGTVDSTDTSTFLGALNVLMSGLVQKYCGKEIFFVTPMSSDYSHHNTDDANPTSGKTMKEYRDAIIERATHHAISVIDLYGMCGMDVAHNADNKTEYSYDGVHPNDKGHQRVHDRIVTFISNILY